MIIKIKKENNFSIISNHPLRDAKLSARAKGIYSFLMTLPSDWEVKRSQIYANFTEGKTALDSAWKELENRGFISLKRVKDETGKFSSTHYIVHELPQSGFPCYGFTVDGKSDTTNNYIELNTKLNKHSKIYNSNNNSEDKFVKPTLKEIEDYLKDRGFSDIDASKFFNYYESGGWTVTRGSKQVPMKSWKGTIGTWHNRNIKSVQSFEPIKIPEIHQEAFKKAKSKWGEIKNGEKDG